ncbi:hypothetical protein TgHK011_004630 [Trichoderma gracile]|nr:hypothetical protein TgHK011_004630 [Trichoderma gracile]
MDQTRIWPQGLRDSSNGPLRLTRGAPPAESRKQADHAVGCTAELCQLSSASSQPYQIHIQQILGPCLQAMECVKKPAVSEFLLFLSVDCVLLAVAACIRSHGQGRLTNLELRAEEFARPASHREAFAQALLGVIPAPFLLRGVDMQAGLWSAAMVFSPCNLERGLYSGCEPHASQQTESDCFLSPLSTLTVNAAGRRHRVTSIRPLGIGQSNVIAVESMDLPGAMAFVASLG